MNFYNFGPSQLQKRFCYHLLECKKCQIQYIGKDAAVFNLRLNNQRKYVHKADAIPASCYFTMEDHIFNTDASFIIIE